MRANKIRLIGSFAMLALFLWPSTAMASFKAPSDAKSAGLYDHGQGGCGDTTANNRWSGMQLTGTRYGAAANLGGNDLYTCSGFDLGGVEGTFGWSNIVGTGFNSIVQVGYGRCGDPTNSGACNSAMNFYYAWGRDSSAQGCSGWSNRVPQPQKWDNHSYDWASHQYWVQEQTSGGTNYWKMFIDGYLVKQEPISSFCWTPIAAQWFAETWDYGDELGGSALNPMNFTNMLWSPSVGGTWYYTNWTPGGTCSFRPSQAFYHCSTPTSHTMQVYTDR